MPKFLKWLFIVLWSGVAAVAIAGTAVIINYQDYGHGELLGEYLMWGVMFVFAIHLILSPITGDFGK